MGKFKNICSVSTVYSLLLYLLYSKEEDINRTFFFFHSSISDEISNKFAGQYYKKPLSSLKINQSAIFRLLIWYRYIKYCKLPSFRGKKLFMQDHLEYSPVFIGRKCYTLIEDAPGILNFYDDGYWGKRDREIQSYASYKYKQFLCGPTMCKTFGHNDQCTDVLLATKYDLDYLKKKTLHYVNVKEKWNELSSEKKDYICRILSIDNSLLDSLRSRKIILFTQPLYKGAVKMNVHEDLHRRLISKYPQEDLLIKPHPRDLFSYETAYPNTVVVRSSLPSQLLYLLGIKFEKAVTLFSTAVYDMGYDLQIDWYGAECHPDVLKYCGHVDPPAGANMCTL